MQFIVPQEDAAHGIKGIVSQTGLRQLGNVESHVIDLNSTVARSTVARGILCFAIAVVSFVEYLPCILSFQPLTGLLEVLFVFVFTV